MGVTEQLVESDLAVIVAQQIGLAAEVKWGQCFLNMAGKVAFGLVHQHINIDGTSSIVDPVSGANSTARGGLYANATNIGTYTNDEFAVVPE